MKHKTQLYIVIDEDFSCPESCKTVFVSHNRLYALQ